MIKKEFYMKKPEAFTERPIPELGIAMIRIEGTKAEIDSEVSKLALKYPNALSTFEDAQLVGRYEKPWADESAIWGKPETMYEEIYSLWVVRKL